ncbi:MAG: ABC1 kinase family protein [Candidatus Zipacnadales bacterium]
MRWTLFAERRNYDSETRGYRGRLSRAIEIAAVLGRYGFGSLLHESGLGHLLPRRGGREAAVGLPPHVALRRAFEEIGPTAVKLGQALGSRADILPPEWVTELRALQDRVAPVPFAEVQRVLEEELGRSVEECFATFDPNPVASASIGQVHRAELQDGRKVAVKIQRPGIHAQVERDLAVLTYYARQAERRWQVIAEHRISEVVRDFAQALRGELDFTLEARNTQLLASLLEDEPRATTAQIYEQHSTARVLTMEWIEGWKPVEAQAIEAAGLDRPTLARNLSGLLLRQILREGCFHADPHGGNVLIGRDGRIVFLDCANLAFVPPHTRDDLVYLMFAILEGDAEDVTAQITAMGLTTDRTDLTSLRADVSRQLVALHSRSTADVNIGQLLEELLSLLFRHHVIMPPIFAQIIRALVLVEGECRNLDEHFDFREIARTIVFDTLRQITRPRRAALEVYRIGRNIHQHAMLLPRQLLALMRKADAGGLKMRFEYDNLDEPMHRLDVMFNRLAFSIVVAAMILAPALWMQVDVGGTRPLWHPAYVLLGLGFALGLWLLASIVRSGRL